MTKCTAAIAFALAVSQSSAFLAPSASSSSLRASNSRSTTVMRSEKSAAASAAAVVAAGVLLQGALSAPVFAEQYQTTAASPTTYLAGFGSPNPSSDPENNNAASGKVNGDKYEPQQTGSFAKKNSAGGNAADYGSPKGTDFGPTAGKDPNAASNTKGTAGAYRADAESPENQGKVNIASKNTGDAANLDVKSVAKDPNAVKGPNPRDAKNSVASAANSAKTVAKKATSGNLSDALSSNGGNPSTSGSDPGAGFSFGVVPSAEKAAKGPADNVKAEVKKNGGDNAKAGKGPGSIGVTASSAADGLKKSITEGKNIVASATGAASEAGDKGRNAATKAADVAANKVSNANVGGVGDAAANAAKQAGNKVSNVNAGGVGDAAANAAKQAGNKVKNEASNLNLSADAGKEINQAKNNPQGKIEKDLNTAKNKVQDDVNTVAKNAPSGNSQAGGFFSDPRGQQEAVRQKTAGKVADDVKTASGSNINLSLGNIGSEANQAKNDPAGKAQKDLNTAKNKVKDDVNTVAKNAPSGNSQAGGFFSDPRGQQEAVRQKTAGKVADDVKTASGSNINLSLGNVGSEVNQAKNNPFGKAQKDFNTAKNKVSDDVKGKNSPEVGGLFGQNSEKQAQQTGQKTVDKVSSDLNEVKKAVESARNEGVTTQFSSSINLSLGNVGGEVNQAKNNPAAKAQKDLNTAANKVKDDVNTVAKNAPSGNSQAGGFFSDPRGQQEAVRQKTAGKVADDVKTASGSNINLSLGNIGGEVNQAKNNPLGKAQKDFNTAKNKVSDDVQGKNSPDVGGLFGQNSEKQAQQTGQKTVDKVSSDLNEVKKAVESARNEGVTTKFSS